jgi:hypothetical protein
MSNYYETTKIIPSKFVSFGSRYSDSTVVYYTENKLLTFNTYKKKNFVTSKNDKFMVISPGYEYRPDLISQMVYGSPDFWWKIMEVNGIKDIFDFKSGVNLRIPDSNLL